MKLEYKEKSICDVCDKTKAVYAVGSGDDTIYICADCIDLMDCQVKCMEEQCKAAERRSVTKVIKTIRQYCKKSNHTICAVCPLEDFCTNRPDTLTNKYIGRISEILNNEK